MVIARKDIGYTIYSRLEESMRLWIKEKLLNLFGDEWYAYIPEGIWTKAHDKISFLDPKDIDDPMIILEELDIPDLGEIVCFRKSFPSYVSCERLKMADFQENIIKLYELRNKIAHVKRNFSSIDLDLLIGIASSFLEIVGQNGLDLKEVLECIKTNPEKVIIRIPSDFFIYEDSSPFRYLTNIPSADYEPDGGFIGRQDDLNKIEKYVSNNLYRVITISGAGGVGKTAVAHRFCQNFLLKADMPFDAVVWVSAKEEKLSLTGIEQIEPTFRNYEDILDSILDTFGWVDDLDKLLEKKEESVNTILHAGDKGILLVVDNLETIRDERVIEYIKTFPLPNKVLITSRMGLGEIEVRYPLKEMSTKDAIILLRTVAREKGATDLAKFPDDILSQYVDKMSRYPLAIKWVVGQVVLGKSINSVVGELTSPTGDIAKFCFEHIFEKLLDEDARIVLYALAAYDKSLVKGVLAHITNLSVDQLDLALRDLAIASFVIPTQVKSTDSLIETKYSLLPLTRNYIYAKLKNQKEIFTSIRNRIDIVDHLVEEAERAGRYSRYSLRDLGAETEEEKIASVWAFTAFQKYQAGDYEGAVATFERASQIAPSFAAIYRNWATMESEAGFQEKADELMKRATNLSPVDSSLWFVWGNIEKRRQRYDRAYTYLTKALTFSPNDPHVLGALGEVEKRRGNFDNADKLIRKALSERPLETNRHRHEVICNTSLADNLRRWAEMLYRDQNIDESLKKLKESYDCAQKASELSQADLRAQDTFREVTLDYGFKLMYKYGMIEAFPYFEKAIVQNARRAKERKTTEVACYYITDHLIKEGKADEAKKYYLLGRKATLEGSKYIDKYKELNIEFLNERTTGKLVSVMQEKGYGFIEVDNKQGQSIFLHISDIVPRITNDDFASLVGSKFSFIIMQGDKGAVAKRVYICKES